MIKNSMPTLRNQKLNLSEFRIRWQVLTILVLLHVGTIASFFFFTPAAAAWALAFCVITGLFGTTVCYHRMLAHDAFQTYRWVQFLHLIPASITLQQGPLSWVRLHRAHHAHSDTEKDPHPQYYGFLFGHCGWPFLSHKTVGRSEHLKYLPPRLKNDKMLAFFETFHVPLFLASLVLFYLWGGLPYLLWIGFTRTTLMMHFTWSVNSIAHRFGYRNYDTNDSSTNSFWVALFSFGEGWHNNHHKYPSSARHGLKPSEIDITWLWIKFLSATGLAWNVRLPESDQEKNSRFESEKADIPHLDAIKQAQL